MAKSIPMLRLKEGEVPTIPDLPNYVLVSGKELYSVYENGFIHSCMRGKTYTSLYARNPEKAYMLCRMDSTWKKEEGFKPDKVRRRTMVWVTDSRNVVMDRSYPSDGSVQMEEDYNIGRALGWDAPSAGKYMGVDSNNLYAITLTGVVVGEFPYMDNFGWGKFDAESRTIRITNHCDPETTHTLRSTGGGMQGVSRCYLSNKAVDGTVHYILAHIDGANRMVLAEEFNKWSRFWLKKTKDSNFVLEEKHDGWEKENVVTAQNNGVNFYIPKDKARPKGDLWVFQTQRVKTLDGLVVNEDDSTVVRIVVNGRGRGSANKIYYMHSFRNRMVASQYSKEITINIADFRSQILPDFSDKVIQAVESELAT